MDVTVTVALGDQKYVLGPCVHEYQQRGRSNKVKPTIVISIQGADTSSNIITERVKSWQQLDDVFSQHFLTNTIVLQVARTTATHSSTAAKVIRECGQALGVDWDTAKIIWLTTSPPKEIPDGPYFIHGQHIFEAWKVYADDCDAFQTTVMPNPSGPYDFAVLNAVSVDGNWKGVAVPSRLYDKPSDRRPLAGKRISIKDNFRLSGITTALESQSFLDTYGISTETAPFVLRLINLGGVIVGKTKLAAFASAENPPENWVDFRCPKNPRGDGYQQPTGSSTGAGAAMAAYEWLDLSIGTDTTGSIRAPAAFCGLYGIRLSTNIAASFAGVYPNSPEFDTIGFLGRDLQLLSHVAEFSLKEGIKKFSEFPRDILFPTDFYPSSNPDQHATILEFVNTLEDFLGVQVTKVSIAERWAEDPPKEAEGKSLVKFLEKTVFNINYYDCYHKYDGFRADHEHKFGKPPYVSPFMKWKWEIGKAISRTSKDQSLKEMAVFKSWFLSRILRRDSHTGSSGVLILPIAMTKPWYRDIPSNPPEISKPFTAMYLTTMVGMPQLVLPVAQTPYFSEVTKRTEYLPFTVSIAGAPGSDLMLLSLANAALNKAGWPTKVKAGSEIFPIGDGMRKVRSENGLVKALTDEPSGRGKMDNAKRSRGHGMRWSSIRSCFGF